MYNNMDVCFNILEKLIINNCFKLKEMQQFDLDDYSIELYHKTFTKDKFYNRIKTISGINISLLKDLEQLTLIGYRKNTMYPFGILGIKDSTKIVYINIYSDSTLQTLETFYSLIYEKDEPTYHYTYFTYVMNKIINQYIELSASNKKLTKKQKLSISIIQKILLENV